MVLVRKPRALEVDRLGAGSSSCQALGEQYLFLSWCFSFYRERIMILAKQACWDNERIWIACFHAHVN